jgi:putative salt-induced outer membrane protein YdiY
VLPRDRSIRAPVATALTLAALAASPASRAAAQGTTPPAPPLWSAKAEVSFVAATGNSSTETLGIGGEFEHQPDGRSQLIRVDFVRSADGGALRAQSLSGLGRTSQRLTPRSEVFGEFSYLRNRFAGIVDRYGIDTGLSYRLLASPRSQLLRVFAGLGYLRESHAVTATRSAAAIHGGVRYRWGLGEHGELVDELQLTDTLAQGHDWRAAQKLNVTAGLTAFVALKVSQRVEYLHRPVPGFRSTDTLTSAALVVKF